MKYKNPRYMFVTGSVKGVPNIDSETYKTTIYYYVKVVVNGQTFYLDESGGLTDQMHATIFGQKEARKLVSEMRNKYSNISLFSTTKKLSAT